VLVCLERVQEPDKPGRVGDEGGEKRLIKSRNKRKRGNKYQEKMGEAGRLQGHVPPKAILGKKRKRNDNGTSLKK